MQRLILPINNAKLTASIDMESYMQHFGFGHYGSDMVATAKPDHFSPFTQLRAEGEGKVVALGWDHACGNILIIRYNDVYNHRTGKVMNVVIRHFHLAGFAVRYGQRVTKETVIGTYGFTGKYAGTCAHLHMEADTDVLHQLYTPTIKASNFLVGTQQSGSSRAYAFTDLRNTCFNVMELLHIKASAPDNQTYITANDVYIREWEKILPKI